MRHSCVRSSVRIVIFLPYAGITVSSREVARFRDHIIRFAATKISAGVSTGIGDHEEKYTGKENEAESGDEQFEIADNRSLRKFMMPSRIRASACAE